MRLNAVGWLPCALRPRGLLPWNGVADRQASTPFGTAAGENCSAIFSGHAGAKSVFVDTLAVMRLIGALHLKILFLIERANIVNPLFRFKRGAGDRRSPVRQEGRPVFRRRALRCSCNRAQFPLVQRALRHRPLRGIAFHKRLSQFRS